MSNELRVITEIAKGKVVITENSQYNKLAADYVTVCEGVSVRLYGTIQYDLIIKKDARVFLHGEIKGKVSNEGGNLTVFNA